MPQRKVVRFEGMGQDDELILDPRDRVVAGGRLTDGWWAIVAVVEDVGVEITVEANDPDEEELGP